MLLLLLKSLMLLPLLLLLLIALTGKGLQGFRMDSSGSMRFTQVPPRAICVEDASILRTLDVKVLS